MTEPEPVRDQATDPALEAFLGERREARLASYLEFLRFPSIGALSEHDADVRATATWLAADLDAAGIEHVEIAETGGHPVVYGDWLHAPEAPTVLVYGHYDVQPVDPLDLWETAPFEPFVRDGRVIGRGAADDKGQIHLHVRAAEAVLATRGALPVNVRYVFEGEEESSSAHLDAWLEANRARLAADVVVISDTSFFEGNLPAITVGLRGMMYAQIDVVGPPIDLHSGGFGGAVENPALALARILADLKDPDGRIRIPGFYDSVRELSADERAALAALPFDDSTFRTETGVPALVGEPGYTTVERLGARPTLDVNGLWGGFAGEGSKTIIPAHAHAKVSCRLVPDQDPGAVYDAFAAHVAAVAPVGVTVTTTLIGTGWPSRSPIDGPATEAAVRALRDAFGADPLFILAGGSIPVAASFERILGLSVLLLGFTNPDDNAHAPNESMMVDNYERGIRAVARFMDEFAATATA